VNAPAAEEVANLTRDNPGLGIGLHLAFTGFRSTLGLRAIPSLLTAEGVLPAQPDGLARAKPEHVLLEARAQLARFRDLLRRRPTHWTPIITRTGCRSSSRPSWRWHGDGLPCAAFAEVQSPALRGRAPHHGPPARTFFGPGAAAETSAASSASWRKEPPS
jgi:hypothetical protein